MDFNKLSTAEIDQILTDLKSNKKTILDCIIYFRQNYNFPLSDCSQIVLDSKVWASERDTWIKNNEETQLEFLKAMRDNNKNSADT